jgi:hypothetical protein
MKTRPTNQSLKVKKVKSKSKKNNAVHTSLKHFVLKLTHATYQ